MGGAVFSYHFNGVNFDFKDAINGKIDFNSILMGK